MGPGGLPMRTVNLPRRRGVADDLEENGAPGTTGSRRLIFVDIIGKRASLTSGFANHFDINLGRRDWDFGINYPMEAFWASASEPSIGLQ
jgi:hypothetical protein